MASDAPFPPPTPDRIRDLIRSQLLELPADFGETEDLFDMGLDSMAIMQLLLMLEESFGAVIPMGEVTRDNFYSTNAIASLVGLKQAEMAG